MEEYVFRMIDEQIELNNKLWKLATFRLNGEKMGDLPEYEKVMLKNQFDAMCNYSEALGNRIQVKLKEEQKRLEQERLADNNNVKSEQYFNPAKMKWEDMPTWVSPKSDK